MGDTWGRLGWLGTAGDSWGQSGTASVRVLRIWYQNTASLPYEELLLIILVIPEKYRYFQPDLGLFAMGERGRPCA